MNTDQRGNGSKGYIDPQWLKWVVHKRKACVFVQVPNPGAAIATATRRIGPMGGWRVGADVAHEVFTREDYLERAMPAGPIFPGR